MEYSLIITGAVIALVFFIFGYKFKDWFVEDVFEIEEEAIRYKPIHPDVTFTVDSPEKVAEVLNNNFKLKNGLYSYKKNVIVDDEEVIVDG